jgi:diguanylate cyclase (GGDEF)-like protein
VTTTPAVARPFRGVPLLWAAYAGLALLLLAYAVSLVVRAGGASSDLVDGWLVAAFELTGGALCVLRAARSPGHRTIPLALGLGAISWSIGDVLLTLESAGGATVTAPSYADAFYLSFYLMAYVALVMLIRRRVHNLTSAMWLDGLAAGLGAAAVCACIVFPGLVASTGAEPATVATNLAYPIGDLLLLALAVGGSAIIPGRRGVQWLLVAIACSINASGDVANLLKASNTPWQVGVIDAVAWPTSILLLSIAMWLPGRAPEPGVTHRPPGMLLPGLGAIAGLAILLVGSVEHVGPAALGLATAALVVVGVRFWLSLHHLRTLTHKRHRQAVTDELTGLGNRRQLFYILNDFFADNADPTTPPRCLGLLFIDLDHFKEINDSFGHAAGDELLRQLGPRLGSSLRGGDALLRVGGDELAVVVMDADVEYSRAVAERLIATLREPFSVGSVAVRIGASIGIASAPADATDAAALLRCADIAMYRAKLSSSSCEVYRADIDADGNRLRLAEELRAALAQRQFVLHYQPQLELAGHEVNAVEALVRWQHPRRGLVPPLDFLPLAEEAGMMPALTEWVVTSALAQCAAWRASGRDINVSVNASVSNLLDDSFTTMLREALARHRLPPSALTIEITETTIIRDFDACRRVIRVLRELGIGVSIDDFGAGFTSLAYLGGLDITELKLDRIFVTALTASSNGRALTLVRGTVELAHTLGLCVVAEGVEDAATLELLVSVGCDVAQGYFISRPVPAAELLLPGAGTTPPAQLRAAV